MEIEFPSRFCDPDALVALSTELPAEYWALLFTRSRLLSLLRPSDNAFLSTKPDDTFFCSRDMRSVMLRLYLVSYVYDDSAAPVWLRCGCCEELFIDKPGIHAVAVCFTGWGGFDRHDRLATILFKWLACPAGLAFQGKHARGNLRASYLAPITAH